MTLESFLSNFRGSCHYFGLFYGLLCRSAFSVCFVGLLCRFAFSVCFFGLLCRSAFSVCFFGLLCRSALSVCGVSDAPDAVFATTQENRLKLLRRDTKRTIIGKILPRRTRISRFSCVVANIHPLPGYLIIVASRSGPTEMILIGTSRYCSMKAM